MRHRRTIDLIAPQKPKQFEAELLDSIPDRRNATPDFSKMTDAQLLRYGQHLRARG